MARENWVIRAATGRESDIFMKFEAEDVYLISLGYSEDPVYWNVQELVQATYLTRSDSTDRVLPIGFGGSSLPPLLLAFPASLSDGTPLVKSVNDQIELHTQYGDRPVIFSFDLSRLGLRSVDDLKTAPHP